MHNAASALLDKCCPALRAADLDLSLSSGNPDLLSAVRASIDMIDPSLFPDVFLLPKELADLIRLCQKCLVLRITFRYIP